MIDCITTTAGAIEEDLMKCLSSSHLMGDFYLIGKDLKNAGIRRQGNIVIEDSKYEGLWNFVLPLFKQMHQDQKDKKEVWSPSKIIHAFGKAINNPESICY